MNEKILGANLFDFLTMIGELAQYRITQMQILEGKLVEGIEEGLIHQPAVYPRIQEYIQQTRRDLEHYNHYDQMRKKEDEDFYARVSKHINDVFQLTNIK